MQYSSRCWLECGLRVRHPRMYTKSKQHTHGLPSNITEHIIAYTPLHGARFAILILNAGGSASAGHLLKLFTELFVGLCNGFGLLCLLRFITLCVWFLSWIPLQTCIFVGIQQPWRGS
ncbi:hypothetical protein BJX96DRAFT_141723 [Aspergillus floccosus]